MYEKLVKQLREYAKEHCPLDRESGICGCIDVREAANAIEELSRAVSVWAKRAMVWAEEAEKAKKSHRWIPVTEPPKEDA